MGGSKNKSPSQKEKSQKKGADQKKSKKTEKGGESKAKPSVIFLFVREIYFLSHPFNSKI